MRVEFYKKTIERYNIPSNRNLNGKIKNITKELLFKINTSKGPELGEIINVQGTKYIIQNVIRMVDYVPENKEVDSEYFIVEVGNYSEHSIHTRGSDSWGENIPIVCDID